MDIVLDIGVNIFFSFIATSAFTLIFNAPRRDLPLCGLCGSVSWMTYYAAQRLIPGGDSAISALIAVIIATCLCRALSYMRKIPLTIYLIGAIIPLVPGTGVYYTMSAAIKEEAASAFIKGVETLKIAGVISVGIIIALSFPKKLFELLPGVKNN